MKLVLQTKRSWGSLTISERQHRTWSFYENDENDVLSLHSSNLWFNDRQHEDQDESIHSGTCKQEDEQKKAVDDDILEEDQTYWQATLEKYSDCPGYGSSIANAGKVYWENELNPN